MDSISFCKLFRRSNLLFLCFVVIMKTDILLMSRMVISDSDSVGVDITVLRNGISDGDLAGASGAGLCVFVGA